jgi:phytoene dehydrogenase-like protein
MRGSMARLHLLVDELPKYIGFSAEEGPQHRGFTLLGASPAVFERGWEAQQRGELMEEYPIELIIQSVTDSSLAPVGMHTITTGIQQLPLHLAQGDWDSRREEFTEKVLKSLFRYAPNLAHAIRGQVMLTPLDWERDFSLTGGNITHGAMTVNQLFDSRPMAGWGHYRSPIKGLYLCGAGTHPGGGVMGAAGHNAAEAILADLRGEAPDKPHVQVKRGVVDSLASDPRIRTLRGRVLRQPWLRPLVRSLTKANK